MGIDRRSEGESGKAKGTYRRIQEPQYNNCSGYNVLTFNGGVVWSIYYTLAAL